MSTTRITSPGTNSPFEGRTFRSSIHSTLVNGILAFDGEKVIEHGGARRLEFKRVIR